MGDPKPTYRLLLKLYPARFREEYGTALEQQFWDDYRDQRGPRAMSAFWLRTLRDLAISIPAETLGELWRDLRRSARVYAKRPLSAMLALVALALAIGVTTGVFSVLSALLLRGLPFREPERLVTVRMFLNVVSAYGGFKNWGLRSAYLEGAAEYSSNEMTLGNVAEPVRVKVAETSSNFFDVLGAEPALGRAFAADEDVPGRGTVAVIGYGLWRRFFAGDPQVLGSTVRLNGVPLTVIGVAPPALDYPARTQVWAATLRSPLPRQAGFITREVIGRLRAGISIARAQGMLLAEVKRVFPEGEEIRSSGLRPLRDELVGPVRRAFLILLVAAVSVLLIACANVALLLLSRTTERRPELAVRAALGASRARLVQQLVTEAVALTLAGAAAGLLIAPWATRLAANAQPAPLAAQAYTILDWRVLGFAVLLAVFTGVLFGVFPALLIGRMQPSHEMARSQPGIAGSGAGRTRVGLVVGQTALTLVLLATTITMGRAFLRLLWTDLGFQHNRVVSMTVSLAGTRYVKNREAQFHDVALERLRAVPGVEAAGAAHYFPLVESDWQYMGGRYEFDAGEVVTGGIVMNAVTSGYFQAIGTDMLAGRDFTLAERRGTEAVAIVNDEFARRIGPVASVVGRRATRDFHATYSVTYTIVGVVRSVRLGGPASVPPIQIYVPVEQRPQGSMTFVARVRGNAADYVPLCRSAVQQVDREIPVYDAKTLSQRLDEVLARPRFYTTATLFMGGFALLLAVVGTYGVAAYAVAQRSREMAMRIAVGATPSLARITVVRQSMAPVLAGMLTGVLGAIGLGRYLHHLIPSAEPLGGLTCVIAALVLSVTALMAVWSATSRVTKLDPMATLKAE